MCFAFCIEKVKDLMPNTYPWSALADLYDSPSRCCVFFFYLEIFFSPSKKIHDLLEDILWILNLLFLLIFWCSGRLIRTLADVKYRKYTMTPVEIIYNIVSFVVAIAITIAFTVYARRALSDLRKAESNSSGGINRNGSSVELAKLPQERSIVHSWRINDV